jgi:hypothetical protein
VASLGSAGHTEDDATFANADAALARLSAAQEAKDVGGLQSALAGAASAHNAVQDPERRRRLAARIGAALQEESLGDARDAALGALLALDDPAAAFRQMQPHLPTAESTAELSPFQRTLLLALGERALEPALEPLKALATRARDPEARSLAIQALGGYGGSPRRAGVLDLLLTSLAGPDRRGIGRPSWTWATLSHATFPAVLAALERLTGRKGVEPGRWIAAMKRNPKSLEAVFDATHELPAAPAAPAQTAWKRARQRLPKPSARAREAVDRALVWLAARQAPDGSIRAAEFASWCQGEARPDARFDGRGDAQYDVGVTALAVNAFLVAGHDGAGAHAHDATVRKALAWLVTTQAEDGLFGPRSLPSGRQVVDDGPEYVRRGGVVVPMPGRRDVHSGRGAEVYNHAVATLALVEAAALTGEARLREHAQRGIHWLEMARNAYYGWGYGIKQGEPNTSVTTWMGTVLACARMVNAHQAWEYAPALFHFDEDSLRGGTRWIERATDEEDGRVGYRFRGRGPSRPDGQEPSFPTYLSEAPTAAATFLLVSLGRHPTQDPAIRRGAALVAGSPPTWDDPPTGEGVRLGRIDMIHWHFGTLAMQKVGGTAWRDWEKALLEALLPHQRLDGDVCGVRGSWDPVDPWGAIGGRVYATAINALTLLSASRFPSWAH